MGTLESNLILLLDLFYNYKLNNINKHSKVFEDIWRILVVTLQKKERGIYCSYCCYTAGKT